MICPLYKQALIAHTDNDNLKVWSYIVNSIGDETIQSLISCDENNCRWWSRTHSQCTVNANTQELRDVNGNLQSIDRSISTALSSINSAINQNSNDISSNSTNISDNTSRINSLED